MIGLDRLKAVRWPIIQRSWLKPIIAIWILSAVLASPQVLTQQCQHTQILNYTVCFIIHLIFFGKLAIFRVLQGPFREVIHAIR